MEKLLNFLNRNVNGKALMESEGPGQLLKMLFIVFGNFTQKCTKREISIEKYYK